MFTHSNLAVDCDSAESTFSPVDSDIDHMFTASPRPEDCIKDDRLSLVLKSLEGKGKVSSSASKAQICTSLTCDLIESLTDAEMTVIDAYANEIGQLSCGEIDPDEAYALAMDSFVRGIEQSQTPDLAADDIVNQEVSVTADNTTKTCHKSDECEFLFVGTSLHKLFRLPEGYISREEVSFDFIIVIATDFIVLNYFLVLIWSHPLSIIFYKYRIMKETCF